jgi:hypothetical protein
VIKTPKGKKIFLVFLSLPPLFVAKTYGKGRKGTSKKYYNDAEWKALSSEAQVKIINEQKKAMGDDGNGNKSVATAKLAKSKKSIT